MTKPRLVLIVDEGELTELFGSDDISRPFLHGGAKDAGMFANVESSTAQSLVK
jgi:hypothetical protein